MREAVALLHDDATALQVRAERAFLGALEGGCQVPIGALAIADGDALTLHGFIADVDGRRTVRGAQKIDRGNTELTGIRLANELRGRGASAILESLRRAEQLPAPQPE
jgi:hydroxymethylbilane synthase